MNRITKFWLLASWLALLVFKSVEAVNINAWTPTDAEFDQSVLKVELDAKRYYLAARFSLEKKIVRLELEKTVTDKNTGLPTLIHYTVKYDVNYVGLYFKPFLKALGLKRLPASQDSSRIEVCRNVAGQLSWVVFLQNSRQVIWLSSFVKRRGSNIVKGQIKLLAVAEPLDVTRLAIINQGDGLTFFQAGQLGYFSADGSGLIVDSREAGLSFEKLKLNQANFICLDTGTKRQWWFQTQTGKLSAWGKLIGVINDKDSNWLTLKQSKVNSTGRYVFADSLELRILDNDGRFTSIYIGHLLASLTQLTIDTGSFRQLRLLKIIIDGRYEAALWLNTLTLTAPPNKPIDFIASAGAYWIDSLSSVVSIVSATGSLTEVVLDYENITSYQALKLSDLARDSTGVLTDDNVVEQDEAMLVIDYKNAKGVEKKALLWPERQLTSDYYGQLIYAGRDSVCAFRQPNAVVIVNKSNPSEFERFIPRNKNTNMIKTQVRKIGDDYVVEMVLQYIDSIFADWLWLKNNFLSCRLGTLVDRVSFDSRAYVFVDYKTVSIIAPDKNWVKSYSIEDIGANGLTDLTKYAVTIYKETAANDKEVVLARIVYDEKNVNGNWLLNKFVILRDYRLK